MSDPSESPATAMRSASEQSARIIHPQKVLRMNLFVLVRVLFQYLERVDRAVLHLAKEVSLYRGRVLRSRAAIFLLYVVLCMYYCSYYLICLQPN